VRLSDLSPRSKLAGAVGILLLVASVLSYPHYVATACFVFVGPLLLVMVVFAQPAFARFNHVDLAGALAAQFSPRLVWRCHLRLRRHRHGFGTLRLLYAQ
jgi:hypothetical protein